ncbi:RNA ligase family protein [Halorubrum sp. DTA98]|uniref:RNA ligase family protein n=1 Tax=Halorubrum sp. DTA98 TaxID=3402163 RepID=UPI003AACF841
MTTMQEFPPLPPATAATDVFESGHLWIEELIDGGPLRFRVTETGLIEFGDVECVFDPDAIPLRYRHAVRTIRDAFARDAFRHAVADVRSVTFFGVATDRHRIAYDLEETPAFLGSDVYDAERGRFLSPDATQRVFEHVGLVPIEPLSKEVRAVDVDPDAYAIPESSWYDGPAAGVVFRNKAGGRAVRRHPDLLVSPGSDRDAPEHGSEALDALIAEHVSDEWMERIVEACGEEPATVEGVVERALERLGRETPLLAAEGGASESDVRSLLVERADRYLRKRQ